MDSRTSIPLFAVLLTTIVACLLALINIGSSVAFNDVISLSISGLYSTYLICCALLLYRRLKGHMADEPEALMISNSPQKVQLMPWGPFRVRGILGVIVNTLAVLYLLIMIFFSFWPPATPTTPATMNFSVLVMGAVMIFSILYYVFMARNVFRGPSELRAQ